MALLGLTLVLASVVYAVIWRPPLVQTFLAIWRGEPIIQQPPPTRRLPPPATKDRLDSAIQDVDGDGDSTKDENEDEPLPTSIPESESVPTTMSKVIADQGAMPPPPPPHTPSATQRANGVANASIPQIRSPSSSPQTTPKAVPSTSLNGSNIPCFSLSDPPASVAAIARAADVNPSLTTLPTLSAPSPPPHLPTPMLPVPSKTSMAPPPRPPTLNNINNSGGGGGSSFLGVPSRGPLPNRQPQHQYDRQPGTSTLAPPPTHSTKPQKPSRKVTLEPGRSPLDWARLANHPSSDLRNLGPGAPYLRVTPSMLRRQTGRKGKDAWTVLGGRVYNITPYLPFHPGGEPELLRVAGRDGSKLFGEIHPWVNFETMLSSCLIGLPVEEHEAKSAGEMDAMD
ncbi:uncharacterized protein GGS25DRAFT_455401 [Hypoxylon fragiforme]|uniref:uncharacterized protein n=1 Tax=Hypoxylon fragiforme TaxID=63214 RepID=UPI0020C66A33|nr:uncharacterized protein GGS25DRAFT_455401 [Hypoxylon fragiforme]KAI2604310.1 hypothetical protein GGS25DRAFT_455401 [Hypoxylon fragiforme]